MFSGDECYGDDVTSGVFDSPRYKAKVQRATDNLARLKAEPGCSERCVQHREACARYGSFGQLTSATVAAMAVCREHRLTQVLVRMGGCRFVAGAQDVDVIVQALVAAGDYVRDFSIPVVQS